MWNEFVIPRLQSTRLQAIPISHITQDFVKECQTKGEIIKKADYRLLNVTALFIIAVLITGK